MALFLAPPRAPFQTPLAGSKRNKHVSGKPLSGVFSVPIAICPTLSLSHAWLDPVAINFLSHLTAATLIPAAQRRAFTVGSAP